jgi:tetratricopeptide (TPR) repeat protein
MEISRASAAPAARKQRWLIGSCLVVALAAGAYGWYRHSTPAPPEIDVAGTEPSVAEAVAAATQAVRQSPRSGAAWGELGMVLFANDFVPQSHACFVQAERFDPETPAWPYLQAWWLLLQDREAAMPALCRAVACADRFDPQNPVARLVLAEVLFEKDERQARELCQQVLTIESDNPRAHFDLGLIALSQDNPEQCIEHLRRSVASPFSGKRSCLHLAAAYRRLGDSDSAAAFLERAKDLPEDRTWPDAYVLKAKEYAVGKKAYMQRAENVAAMGQPGDHVLALRELAAEAGDGLSHYRLGVALAAAGDYRAAEPVLRAALRADPGLAAAHYALGIVLLRQGEALPMPSKKGGRIENPSDGVEARQKFEDAAARLARAAQLKPTDGLIHLYLGRTWQLLGRAGDALVEFRTAVQCRPDLAEAHLHLGEALAEAGDKALAARHLEHACGLAPADPRPRAALERLKVAAKKKPADDMK